MAATLAEVQALLIHESALLDDECYSEWLALYSDDATYWVPIAPGQGDPIHELSIIYDTKVMMEARTFRLTHAKVHSHSPPSRSVRILSNVQILSNPSLTGADGYVKASAKLIMLEYRQNETRSFGASVSYDLQRGPEGLRIRAKRVDLINSTGSQEMISVPF